MAAQLGDRMMGELGGVPAGAFPAGLLLLDSLLSILVSVAVIVPWWTGWVPILTPLAAAVLVVFNVLQLATQYGRTFAGNVFFTGSLALVIAIGRFMEL
ncbi:hypothetical protein ACFQ07_22755 [Actinomadura adrarensis]|uniref:Uncharacterized protein n=1 Tax=Actinomadura adrarensis TaxID=1819600 RepID=A0ABW3CNA7_9ACTN